MNKKFENIIKQKVDESEFAFDPSDWKALEKQLPPQSSPWYKSTFTKGLAAIFFVASISLIYLSQSDDSTHKQELVNKEQQSIPESKKEENENQLMLESESKTSKKESTTIVSKPESSEKDNLTRKISSNSNLEQEINLDEKPKDEFGQNDMTIEINGLDTISTLNQENFKLSIKSGGYFCKGESINFSSNFDGEHVWSLNGTLQKSTSNELEIELSHFQTYSIQLEAGDLKWDTTFEINALPTPLDFTYLDSDDPYMDEAAELKSSLEGDGMFKWNISEIEGEISGNPINVDFGQEGIFDVELTYIDHNGCEYNINKPVAIKTDFDPLAPNRYTPDGNGLNETFMPKGFENVEYESFKFYIFNSQGQLVYTSISPDQPWNGRVNNTGEKLIGEYFVWKVVLQNKSREKAFTGKAKILSF